MIEIRAAGEQGLLSGLGNIRSSRMRYWRSPCGVSTPPLRHGRPCRHRGRAARAGQAPARPPGRHGGGDDVPDCNIPSEPLAITRPSGESVAPVRIRDPPR